MTTISVKIIACSSFPDTPTLTTMQLRYPRFIHSEFMTHRVFSRNASSSRAIPVARTIRDVMNDPAEPVQWGSNQAGMQAGRPLSGWRLWLTKFAWHGAKWGALGCAYIGMKAGVHKQVINRILEPWTHISVVVTATEWDNFFDLRTDRDADPTFQKLAKKMWFALQSATPTELKPNQWHLPYILEGERHENPSQLRKISAARCARVSYLTHDGKEPSAEKDLALYDRLVNARKLHASPLEHQALPNERFFEGLFDKVTFAINFRGWVQNRHFVEQSLKETQEEV